MAERTENEAERLAALSAYVLDGPPDPSIDAILRVVATLCETPLAAVSMVGATKMRILQAHGAPCGAERPRSEAFCTHTIGTPHHFEVRDAAADARFANSPFVVGEAHLRFYAGVPLIDADGFALGALCVLGPTPKTLSEAQRATMRELAGVVVRILQAKRDETARLAAEAEVRRVEAELRAIIDALPADVAYWGADLRNRVANPRYLERFGVAGVDIRGMHMRDVITDRYPGVKWRLERVVAGEAVQFERTRSNESGEDAHLQISYVPHVEGGATVGFVTFGVDVTPLKRAELALSAERAFLEAVLERIPNTSVMVVDEDLRAHKVYGAETFGAAGRTRAEYEGRLIAEFVLPANREKAEDAARRCLAGETAELDLHAGGRHIDCRLVPYRDPSGRAFALVVSHDVTEADRLGDELARHERLAATGMLAAGVGHEINNPLTYIVTNLELVQEAIESSCALAPTPPMREALEMLAEARGGVDHIRKIVQGLRAFSRTRDTLEPTDLGEALRIAIDMTRHEVRNRAELVKDDGPIPIVIADVGQLAQVFVNLLLNAAQCFGDSDPTKNRVVVRTFTDARGHAVLEVEDNGPGIAPSVLPRVFDPFFTTKSVGKGSGLGLSICHGLVASLGGEIVCESTVGVGTTLRVAFPPSATIAAAPPRLRPSAAVPKTSPRARVLVIDDDEAVARSVARSLSNEHDVTSFTDPRAALAELESDRVYDVVFCDLVMPHLNGMELFQTARARRPAMASRFVFMTGGVVRPDLVAFLAETDAYCLEKPFEMRKLRALVNERLVERSTAVAH